MTSLLIARQTIKRMLRSNYFFPMIAIAIVVVIVFLAQSKPAGKIPFRVLLSTSAGLFLITNVFCLFGSIWLAISIVPDELNSGTLRMNLTKPVRMISVLFGHFLGTFSYLVAGAMLMAFLLNLFAAMRGGQPGFIIIGYVLQLLPLYGCLLALGSFLVLLTNRPVAAFLMIFFSNERFMFEWAQKASSADIGMIVKLPLMVIGHVGYALSPPISRLKISIIEYSSLDFPFEKYLLVLLYCASYILLAHLAATWILKHKEI